MNNPVSQSHCIDSKQFTLFEVMRSLFRLGFFVFFASLHSSLGFRERWCGYGFVLKEGNAVGRGFKNWDNYTQYKWVVHDNCIHPVVITQIFKVYEGMREREEVYELRVQSNRKEVQFERGTIANRSTRQVRGLHVLSILYWQNM